MSIIPADLATRRRRVVEWGDPAVVRQQMDGMSGLEIMRGIRDGTIPRPPMAALVDFECKRAERGEIDMQLVAHEALENNAGLIHGGATATMLDTAMGAAVNTTLPPDKMALTLDLKLTYLRPLTLRSGPITASARVLSVAGRTAYAEGSVRDGAGELAAHSVGIFSIIALTPPSPKAPRQD
jgi:uncharacterized protein (TIGR00369 family)